MGPVAVIDDHDRAPELQALTKRPPGYAEWLTISSRASMPRSNVTLEKCRGRAANTAAAARGDLYIDLRFYHLKLRAYVVIELKATNFKPEHTGQLGFYLTAVDAQLKTPEDAPTIGLLLCKSKNRIVAEYALRDTNEPIEQ